MMTLIVYSEKNKQICTWTTRKLQEARGDSMVMV